MSTYPSDGEGTEGFYRCPIQGCAATFSALVDVEAHAIEDHGVLRDVVPEVV